MIRVGHAAIFEYGKFEDMEDMDNFDDLEEMDDMEDMEAHASPKCRVPHTL